MGDLFQLQGSYGTEPSSDSTQSLDPSVGTPIAEIVALSKKITADYELTADGAQAVGLGSLTGVNVLIVKVAEGKKIIVRVTSADGATQSIPVNTVLILTSLTVPITALDLTRVAGIGTTVRVFLGQSA